MSEPDVDEPPASTLFRGVDVATFVAALSERLRAAGVATCLSSSHRCAAAMRAVPPTDVRSVYWTTRVCLIRDPRDLPAFDAVFAAVFDHEELPTRAGRDGPPEQGTLRARGEVNRQSAPTDAFALLQGRIQASRRAEIVEEGEHPPPEDEDSLLPELLPAAVAEVADRPFEELDPAELDRLGAWLADRALDLPHRRARRHRRVSRGGRIDLRRTMADARSTFGDPVHLHGLVPRERPRRLAALLDVSGSMEAHARVWLHLLRTLATVGQAEVFTFATEITRVTVPLRERDAEAAIARMSAEVGDRFSGTRIATSLGELLARPSWTTAVRGATVVIVSDGWDSDPPEELVRRMVRLHRLAHRVIWVNPRLAAAAYEPLVAGMAAALPHVDALHSGHSARAVLDVLAALTDN